MLPVQDDAVSTMRSGENPSSLESLVDGRPQGRHFLYAQVAETGPPSDPTLGAPHVGKRRPLLDESVRRPHQHPHPAYNATLEDTTTPPAETTPIRGAEMLKDPEAAAALVSAHGETPGPGGFTPLVMSMSSVQRLRANSSTKPNSSVSNRWARCGTWARLGRRRGGGWRCGESDRPASPHSRAGKVANAVDFGAEAGWQRARTSAAFGLWDNLFSWHSFFLSFGGNHQSTPARSDRRRPRLYSDVPSLSHSVSAQLGTKDFRLTEVKVGTGGPGTMKAVQAASLPQLPYSLKKFFTGTACCSNSASMSAQLPAPSASQLWGSP